MDRAQANQVLLDWLTFDEGYGMVPEFVRGLDDRKLLFVGEAPKKPVVPGGQRLRAETRRPGKGAARR